MLICAINDNGTAPSIFTKVLKLKFYIKIPPVFNDCQVPNVSFKFEVLFYMWFQLFLTFNNLNNLQEVNYSKKSEMRVYNILLKIRSITEFDMWKHFR